MEMIVVWTLVLVGLFLLYLEFFFPGAILAVIGSSLLLASAYVFHWMRPGATHLVKYFLVLSIAIFTVVKFASWRLHIMAKKIPPPYPKDLVGKKGKTATKLTPAGRIFIDDKIFQAQSLTGPIGRGEDVTIVRAEESHLIVESTRLE